MSPRTRRALLLGLAAAVALVAAWLLWPRTAITRENGAKIREGMALAEVEAILGGPARNEAGGTVILDEDADVPAGDQRAAIVAQRWRLWQDAWIELRDRGAAERPLQWGSDWVVITIHLDGEGRVADCTCLPVRRTDEGPLEFLRRWFIR
jgi:hypothetical protein